jgi:polyisoprenoid-binding protein YceI
MATTTWQIDPAHNNVEFAVRHLMISTVKGRFGKVEGTIEVDEERPETAKIDVAIDVGSIDTRQEQRDAHLRSPDFFDVANYPAMRFVSKRIEGDPRGSFKVIGDLTIRGTTREVTLDVASEGAGNDPWGNVRAGFSATTKIDRAAFGLTWNQALETGGVVVGNDIKVSIDAEVFRPAAVVSAAA